MFILLITSQIFLSVVFQIFGPVMQILKFKTIDEAIERANNTTYGLGAGVFTSNLENAIMTSHGIRAGLVWWAKWTSCRQWRALYEIWGGGARAKGTGKFFNLDPGNSICSILRTHFVKKLGFQNTVLMVHLVINHMLSIEIKNNISEKILHDY